MNHIARHGRTLGFVLDLLTMVSGYYLAYTVDNHVTGHAVFLFNQNQFFETELLCYCAWALAIVACMEYPNRRKFGVLRDFLSVVTINLSALLVFAATVFILKQVYVSRMFMLTYVLTQIVMMAAHRGLVRCGLYLVRWAGWNHQSRIVVGADENAIRYIEEVVSNKRFGLRLAGYIAEREVGLDVPYLGRIDDINRILSTRATDGVVIALDITNAKIMNVIRTCEILGISMELLLDGLSSQIASGSIHHGTRVSSLTLSAIPHSPSSLLVKRVTDIILSLFALVMLSPLFLGIAVAIKLEDGGPVLFTQERVGLRNKPFKMYKFRSMRIDAEDLKQSLLHLNEMSGPVFKLTNDPRITRVGSFIRRTSMDELPQFINVLIGNMSLVGPRPPLPSEVANYDDSHRRRLSVKPGMTCLWQVNGRNNIDFDSWMKLDLSYIDNWSYLTDWKIIFQTIPAVIKRHGAR